MTHLPRIVLAVIMVLAAVWTAQALYDWEWTRALWLTMAFVAAEVALIGLVVVHRLTSLSSRIGELERADDSVLRRLEESRPSIDRFGWLREATRGTNVFVTMVIGGGILVSGALWVIDKVAGRTLTRTREQQLAGRLEAIAFPVDGFVPARSPLFADDLTHEERNDLALLLTGREHGAP